MGADANRYFWAYCSPRTGRTLAWYGSNASREMARMKCCRMATGLCYSPGLLSLPSGMVLVMLSVSLVPKSAPMPGGRACRNLSAPLGASPLCAQRQPSSRGSPGPAQGDPQYAPQDQQSSGTQREPSEVPTLPGA